MILFIIFANVPGEIEKPGPNTVTLNAAIYLPTATLKPILQRNVDQQVASQGWVGSLVHPTITKLTPQSNGLAMTLGQSLYPGGPQTIESNTLLTFSVLDSSTIQVSGQSPPGSTLSVNGPLDQIKLPQGQLNSISPTPNCGDSALAVKMGFPISLSQGQESSQTSSGLPSEAIPHAPTDAANAYVEIPSSALSTLGKNLGSFPINHNLTAENIRIGIENNEIIVRADVSLQPTGIVVASSTIHIQPLANNGNLILRVRQTDISVLFFTFLADNYNQQIENGINQELAGSLGGLFTVTKAAIGTDKHIPCTASDSLILTGTTNMLS